MKSSRLLLATTLASAGLAACDSGRQSLPNARMVVVNAAPSYTEMMFLREQRPEPTDSPLAYGEASTHSFDADQYDFNLDVFPPSGPVRIATFAHRLSEGNDHYAIITERGGEIEPIVFEEPGFDAASSDTEITIFHAGPTLGAVDVYLEAPGADVSAETPLEQLEFHERIEASTFPPGEYEITLTEPGAAGNVVFRSPPFATSAGQDNLLVIADDANRTVAEARLTLVNEAGSSLTDVTAQAALRVVNGARDRAARDVVLNDDFAAPLFAALPFGTEVDYATIAPGEQDITITPAGNPGVLEHETTFSALVGGYYTFIFGGPSGSLESTAVLEDRQELADTARVRFMNAATQFETLDAVIVEPGESLADATSQSRLQAPGFSGLLTFVPGDYELGFRDGETNAVVAGPLAVTLAERSIYSLVALDGPDTTSAEILLLDDFQ